MNAETGLLTLPEELQPLPLLGAETNLLTLPEELQPPLSDAEREVLRERLDGALNLISDFEIPAATPSETEALLNTAYELLLDLTCAGVL